MWPESQSAGVQNIIHHLLWEILLRVVLIAIVCIFQLTVQPRIAVITEAELLTHYKRPRHDSYVPPWAIVIVVVFVPIMCIYIVFLSTKNYVDSIQSMLAWTLALSITALITESLKLIVGRPRPDFFYRCFPNGMMTLGLHCTGNVRDVIEGRKSFPSGHSSFSFCSLGFLSMWVCGKLKVSTQRGHCCRAVACLAPLVLASMVALSRYYDNHHHWSDIVAGSILGMVLSYICYHLYYHPLHSDFAGDPLSPMTENELFESYQLECCTRNLSEDLCLMLHISNTNSVEGNSKIN